MKDLWSSPYLNKDVITNLKPKDYLIDGDVIFVGGIKKIIKTLIFNLSMHNLYAIAPLSWDMQTFRQNVGK